MEEKSKPFILLHGALGSARQLEPLQQQLLARSRVETFTFSGHGGLPVKANFGIQTFAEELGTWLQAKGWQQVPVFGFSMGGYVALYLEYLQPGTFSRIYTLGTKFAWTPESARHETSRLNPDKIEAKVPQFAAMLAERHQPLDWKSVVGDTAQMMLQLGDAPLLSEKELQRIRIPVCIMRGSQDVMVSAEESRWAVNALAQGCYHELSGQPHPFEQLDVQVVSAALRVH